MMKRLITIASCSAVLAFALAYADDNTSATSTNMNTSTNSHMNAPTATTPNDTTRVERREEKQVMRSNVDYDKMQTCRDESGATLTRGATGFDSCISSMKRRNKDQMGGTMGTNSTLGTDPAVNPSMNDESHSTSTTTNTAPNAPSVSTDSSQ